MLNKHLHSTDSTIFLQNIAYTYTERGWLLTTSAPLFATQLYYNAGTNKGYNGNIMYQYWGVPGTLNHYYAYTYDKLNRILTGSNSEVNNEQAIVYDLMGNITAMDRYMASIRKDQLSYTYTSGGNPTNQLQSVLDNSGSNTGLVAGTTSYTWDGNGNMLTDTNSVNMAQNKTVTYNLLNLPQTVKVQHGMVTYTYDALGTKMRKVSVISGTTKTTDYIAGIEYDGGTTDTLNFIQTEEGQAAKFGNIYDYQYYLGDNLGNTRVTFGTKTGAAVSYQTDDYYPFGMEINHTVGTPKNEYLYNKKELQEETQEYDYGARMYDPIIARWNTVDPHGEKYQTVSPYVYVSDNPILLIDPNGMDVTGDTKDVDALKDQATNAAMSEERKQVRLNKRIAKRESKGKSTDKLKGRLNASKFRSGLLRGLVSKINYMETDHTQIYNVSSGFADPTRGETKVDPGTGQINIAFGSIYGLTGLAHELVHGYQFGTGEMDYNTISGAGGYLHDINDEIEAYQVQFAVNSNSLGYSITTAGQITEGFVRALLPDYRNLPSISLNKNTPLGIVDFAYRQHGINIFSSTLSIKQASLSYGNSISSLFSNMAVK